MVISKERTNILACKNNIHISNIAYQYKINPCHTSITKLWTFDDNVHKHNLNLSKIHISSSNEFLHSPKHFNEHLECNNIQTIVINSPIIILLPKSFQTPFNQLKTSTSISTSTLIFRFHHQFIQFSKL